MHITSIVKPSSSTWDVRQPFLSPCLAQREFVACFGKVFFFLNVKTNLLLLFSFFVLTIFFCFLDCIIHVPAPYGVFSLFGWAV